MKKIGYSNEKNSNKSTKTQAKSLTYKKKPSAERLLNSDELHSFSFTTATGIDKFKTRNIQKKRQIETTKHFKKKFAQKIGKGREARGTLAS